MPCTVRALSAQAIHAARCFRPSRSRRTGLVRSLAAGREARPHGSNDQPGCASWVARIARGGCSVPGGPTLLPAPCWPLLERRATAASCLRCECLIHDRPCSRFMRDLSSRWCVGCPSHGCSSVFKGSHPRAAEAHRDFHFQDCRDMWSHTQKATTM